MTFAVGAGAVVSSLYLAVCFYLSRGLKNICTDDEQQQGERCFAPTFCRSVGAKHLSPLSSPAHIPASLAPVSIIICARNEEKNISHLLDCLAKQTYPGELLQIIVADDRSSDKTSEVVIYYKEKIKNLELVKIAQTGEGIAPKKHAFEQAIKKARGEIILQTDADSVVFADWVEKSIAPFAADSKIALSQGIVKYRFDKGAKISPMLKIYQSFDFLSHGIVAAAGIGKNIPLNANANNFAFRKKDYEQSGGYGKLSEAVGGDDGLLMQKFWTSGKKIFFNTNSIVETQPEYSWKNLVNQRKKWGSETRFYLPKQTALLASIFAFYCFALLFPALIVVKIFGELFFMRRGLSIFGEKCLLPHIIWTSPLNLFITIYSVICGIFAKFEWKGDVYRSKTINSCA